MILINYILVWRAGNLIVELRDSQCRVWPHSSPLPHPAHYTVKKSMALCHPTGREGHTRWWEAEAQGSIWAGERDQDKECVPAPWASSHLGRDRVGAEWPLTPCLGGHSRNGRKEKYEMNEMEASLLPRSLPFTDLNHQDGKHHRLISSLVPVPVATTLDRDS